MSILIFSIRLLERTHTKIIVYVLATKAFYISDLKHLLIIFLNLLSNLNDPHKNLEIKDITWQQLVQDQNLTKIRKQTEQPRNLKVVVTSPVQQGNNHTFTLTFYKCKAKRHKYKARQRRFVLIYPLGSKISILFKAKEIYVDYLLLQFIPLEILNFSRFLT